MRRLGPVLLVLSLAACTHAERAGKTATPREQALRWADEGSVERAISALGPLLEASPDDLELARAYVQAHAKAGKLDALIARLQAAPDARASTHYMRGLAHFAQSADADGPAIAELERAIAIAPREAELHYRLGVVLLEAEKYPAAVAPLQQAVQLAPDRAGYNLPLAKALSRTGDRAGAVSALARVVQGKPTPAEVGTARALIDRISDPFAGFPKAAEGRLEQGLKLLQQADLPQQALVPLEEIAREFPDVAVVHALIGLCYQKLDDAGRAVDEFKRAIELQPMDGKTHFYLAELYTSRQRLDAAKEEYERALAGNPLIDEAYFRLGDLALDRQELDVAEAHFTRLTWLEPDAIAPRGKLAAIYQLQGEWEPADRELRKIVEKAPESTEFKLRLGLLHTERATKATRPEERKQAAAEASRWLTQVLEAEPDNALASRALEAVRTP